MVILGLVILLILVGLLVILGRSDDPEIEPVTHVSVELHAIRRRLEVDWLRHQAHVDATQLRRELDRELDELP